MKFEKECARCSGLHHRKHHWCRDCYKDYTESSRKSAVYMLIHKRSGKFYLGSSTNFAQRKSDHVAKLRRGSHYNADLQRLYNDSPEIEFKSLANIRDEDLSYVEQLYINDCRVKFPTRLLNRNDADVRYKELFRGYMR